MPNQCRPFTIATRSFSTTTGRPHPRFEEGRELDRLLPSQQVGVDHGASARDESAQAHSDAGQARMRLDDGFDGREHGFQQLVHRGARQGQHELLEGVAAHGGHDGVHLVGRDLDADEQGPAVLDDVEGFVRAALGAHHRGERVQPVRLEQVTGHAGDRGGRDPQTLGELAARTGADAADPGTRTSCCRCPDPRRRSPLCSPAHRSRTCGEPIVPGAAADACPLHATVPGRAAARTPVVPDVAGPVR